MSCGALHIPGLRQSMRAQRILPSLSQIWKASGPSFSGAPAWFEFKKVLLSGYQHKGPLRHHPSLNPGTLGAGKSGHFQLSSFIVIDKKVISKNAYKNEQRFRTHKMILISVIRLGVKYRRVKVLYFLLIFQLIPELYRIARLRFLARRHLSIWRRLSQLVHASIRNPSVC